jgi:hypothetical protein
MEQTKESIRKVYPSQINTKSLACRIPAADYVNFLQDAISKGINLNDWLLMKVYGSKPETMSVNGVKIENSSFPIVLDFKNAEIWGYYEINNREDVISVITSLQENLDYAYLKATKGVEKKPTILDAKIQISKIAKNKFSTKKYREFLEDLNDILSDLED